MDVGKSSIPFFFLTSPLIPFPQPPPRIFLQQLATFHFNLFLSFLSSHSSSSFLVGGTPLVEIPLVASRSGAPPPWTHKGRSLVPLRGNSSVPALSLHSRPYLLREVSLFGFSPPLFSPSLFLSLIFGQRPFSSLLPGAPVLRLPCLAIDFCCPPFSSQAFLLFFFRLAVFSRYSAWACIGYVIFFWTPPTPARGPRPPLLTDSFPYLAPVRLYLFLVVFCLIRDVCGLSAS